MERCHEKIRRALEETGPSRAQRERLVDWLEAAQQAPSRQAGTGRRKLTALLALCAVLAATALAAGPTVLDALEHHLGPFAPYLTGGGAGSVSAGIELEVAGAVSNGASARVYLTACDREGGRLDAYTSVSLDLEGANSWGVRTLAFDESCDTLLLELEAEGLYDDGRLSIDGGTLLSGQYPVSVCPDLEAVPEQALASVEAGSGKRVLLADQAAQSFDGLEGFSTLLGFDEYGQFHVRTIVEEGYRMTSPSSVFVSFSDGSGFAAQSHRPAYLEDGQDVWVEEIDRDNWDRVEKLWLLTSYEGSAEPINGAWSLEVSVAETAGITTSGDFALHGPDDLTVTEVSLSPLGVVASYTGGADSLPEDALQVILKDGSQPGWGDVSAWNWGGDGYVVWNFEAPVALEDVASVVLLGETIPLPP